MRLKGKCLNQKGNYIRITPKSTTGNHKLNLTPILVIILKKILDNINVKYVPEYNPLINRFFSIDIAFPDKKIGIEINGNQHYNIHGSLKEYYQIQSIKV